ncbi:MULTISPECIES: hypothetical protein [Streptomyces]|nr:MULTISPECIES: hypothetical protein [Streptomyces]
MLSSHGDAYSSTERPGLNIVLLDEVTESLPDTRLRHRHRRWPITGNSYPFINRQAKADSSPVTPLYVELLLEALGAPASNTSGSPSPPR